MTPIEQKRLDLEHRLYPILWDLWQYREPREDGGAMMTVNADGARTITDALGIAQSAPVVHEPLLKACWPDGDGDCTETTEQMVERMR